MNLSPPLQYAMTQINRALMVGDQAALVAALTSVDLPQLLSQDTLEKVRARGKNALAIFLATLAGNNGIEENQARFWLACYQSINQKQLLGSLQALKPDNALRLTLEVLMGRLAGLPEGQRLNGKPQQWVHAFELAIDHKQWPLAGALLTHANPKALKPEEHRQVWLQFSKLLAKRHNLFVDNSGQTHVDVDYSALARLYGQCERFLSEMSQPNAAISVAYLQAKCLEAAKQYEQALDVLNAIAKRKPAELQACLINSARCECKQGHMAEAIAHLDRVIAQQIERPEQNHDTGALTGTAAPAPAQEGKAFNVANASRALADLATIFKAHQIPFFLVSGTLLGYAREGQLLKHDKDIDVGVLGWEHQYTIGMALQQSTQFSISTDFLKGERVYYIPVSHNETGFIIDLFFYHEDNGRYVTGVDFFFGHQQTFAFSPFELQETEFLGVPMYVPSDVDRKLTENFGNWRVSDPGYISHLEAPCTVNPGGKDHMLTARLQLINALNENKTHKVERIVRILRQHAASPWGMAPELLDKVGSKVDAQPADAHVKATLHSEVAHA